MTSFERFDVAVALFPFTDADVRKPRPVLVISGAPFNRAHGHVIGSMITTGADSRWPTDHPIGDLPSAGLRHPSVVRWKLFTLPEAVVARKIGSLGTADRDAIARRLAEILVH